MIQRVKREDYSSDEEYLKVYQEMLEAIKEHNRQQPEYDPNYKEEFLKFIGIKTKD